MKTFKQFFEKTVIGLIERINLHGIGPVDAKIDSGNGAYNVLHGEDIVRQGNKVMFKTVDGKKIVKDVKEMEAKVAAAEAKSQKVNVEIIEKVVKKTEYIKLRGQDIIKYVDRDIVKYDTKFAPGGQCEIPKEFITLHNKAAEAPK